VITAPGSVHDEIHAVATAKSGDATAATGGRVFMA
jgi:hypothetical protein